MKLVFLLVLSDVIHLNEVPPKQSGLTSLEEWALVDAALLGPTTHVLKLVIVQLPDEGAVIGLVKEIGYDFGFKHEAVNDHDLFTVVRPVNEVVIFSLVN